MRVLIIGCRGFIGQAIAASTSARGIETFGLGRSASDEINRAWNYVQADRTDYDGIRDILERNDIDVVIDVIPMVLSDTRPLLTAFEGKIEQYVMISSADVYANYELLHKKSAGTPLTDAADERSRLRTSLYPYRLPEARTLEDPKQYLDNYDKIPIERAVQELACAWTILRLPMVYGPGDRQRRFRWAIAPMLKGVESLSLPRAWAEWTTTYGYIENVGAAIASTVGQHQAYGEIFNVAEESPVSQLSWAKRFAQATSWQGVIEVSDDPSHPILEQTAAIDLDVPFKIDGHHLRKTLNFIDPVDEAAALARTIESETV